MGQHLHLYATKELSGMEVESWANYRANDLFETPGETAQTVEREMRRLERSGGDDHYEDGPGINEWKSHLFVWKPQICAASTIALVNGFDPKATPLMEWLQRHVGFLIWGDNDGI
jgi:hypothetical protein